MSIDFDTKQEHHSDMTTDADWPDATRAGFPTRVFEGSSPSGGQPRCFRHEWCEHFRFGLTGDEQCAGCGSPRIIGTAVVSVSCKRCGKVRDEAVKRRNRGNKNRGGAFERSIATKLGARRTGPLGGRDDVLGETVAVQTKKTINFSVRQARAYLDDLSRTYPTRTALVIHAEPGKDREAVVILSLNSWLALHGPDGMEERDV